MSSKFIVAVAFVIERDGAILMLRRSPQKDHAPGEWETGSGRVEAGEHPEEAVHREVREETGLQVDIIGPVATFHFYRGAAREETIGITFWCRYRAGELVSSEEHDRAIWVSPDEAKSLVGPSGLADAIEHVARNIGSNSGWR
jgi:8-oxo-dGTP pyrophosphatase MutT (NUDIX family)